MERWEFRTTIIIMLRSPTIPPSTHTAHPPDASTIGKPVTLHPRTIQTDHTWGHNPEMLGASDSTGSEVPLS